MRLADLGDLGALDFALSGHQRRPRNVLARVQLLQVVARPLKLLLLLLDEPDESGRAFLHALQELRSELVASLNLALQLVPLSAELRETADELLFKGPTQLLSFAGLADAAFIASRLLRVTMQVRDAQLVHETLLACLQ